MQITPNNSKQKHTIANLNKTVTNQKNRKKMQTKANNNPVDNFITKTKKATEQKPIFLNIKQNKIQLIPMFKLHKNICSVFFSFFYTREIIFNCQMTE